MRGVDLEVKTGEMFIPIFFLVVNTGQAAEVFPSDSTGFLEGQVSSLIVLLATLWGVVYAGFMQLIALKTRSAAATNSGGLAIMLLLNVRMIRTYD